MPKEQLEIKVSQKTACNGLAASIVAAWREGKDIVLSAIGPVPVSQAFKAVCVANRALASQGVHLIIMPGLVMKQMPDLADPERTVPWVVAKMKLRDLLAGPPTSEDVNESIQAATGSFPATLDGRPDGT